MSRRTVSVKLAAEVGNYVAGMKQAAAATKDLATRTSDTTKRNEQAWNTVGTSLLAMGAAVGVGVGLAVKRFADFDAAMSEVKASTRGTAAQMDLLREAALQAGAKTAFSATEAARGIDALAKAGVSTRDILGGGLSGALSLAAAGSLEVGDAAEIAASAMTQFGLKGGQVGHIADLLAAGAGKAQGSVQDMGAALGQVGLVANQTGLTIEETTGGLAAFAAAGLTGSDAGTSFKTALMSLNPRSAEAADLMDSLGLRAYDAQGNFVGLSEYAGQLQTALGGMTDEQRNATLATIFGSDAVRAAAVLYENGASGVQKWEDAVDDAGFAQETAATKLDNLKGDVEAFGGSLETAFIKSGSSANGVLRELVQLGTAGLNAYGALPAPVQATATGLGALAAAGGLAGGAFLLAVPKIAEFRTALADMGPGAQRFGRGLGVVGGALAGPWGLAIGAGVIALGLFGNAKAKTKAKVEEFTAAILADSGAIGENTRKTVVAELGKQGLLKTADALGLSLRDVTDAALGDKSALDRLRQAQEKAESTALDAANAQGTMSGTLDETAQSAADTSIETGVLVSRVQKLAGITDESSQAARRQAEALGEAETAETGLGGAVTATTREVQDQTAEVRALTTQVLTARDANRGYEAALDDATAALKENGRTLDIGTEKGRANQEALDGIASSANDVLQSMIDAGTPLDQVSAKLGVQREALITTATRFGMTKAQAVAYADSVLQIPEKAATTVTTPGAAGSKTAIEGVTTAVRGVPGEKKVVVNTTAGAAAERIREVREALGRLYDRTVTVTTIQKTVYIAQRDGVGGGLQRAAGGWITGPGTATSDSIPARLSNGEFVVNARSAQQNAALLEAINSNRFATGGWVGGGRGEGSSSGGGDVNYHLKVTGLIDQTITEQTIATVLRRAEVLAGM